MSTFRIRTERSVLGSSAIPPPLQSEKPSRCELAPDNTEISPRDAAAAVVAAPNSPLGSLRFRVLRKRLGDAALLFVAAVQQDAIAEGDFLALRQRVGDR